MFDTSSEDVDVNLNQKLIELLVSQDAQSKLPPVGGEEITVFVSYVAKNGDIFVQKESSTFTMIEKMIVEVIKEMIGQVIQEMIGDMIREAIEEMID